MPVRRYRSVADIPEPPELPSVLEPAAAGGGLRTGWRVGRTPATSVPTYRSGIPSCGRHCQRMEALMTEPDDEFFAGPPRAPRDGGGATEADAGADGTAEVGPAGSAAADVSTAGEMLAGLLGFGSLAAFASSVLFWCGGACQWDQDSSPGRAFLWGLGLGLAAIVVAVIDGATATGAARDRAREQAATEAWTTWVAQLDAWGYDAPGTGRRTWPPAGFVTHDVMHGTMVNGQAAPLWSTCHLQLAPPGEPHLAARVAPHQPGPPIEVPVEDIVSLQARSRSGSWFGLGASGAMAAHAAASLDYHLAGYELTLVTRSGLQLQLRKLGGTPPVAELRTVEARAAGAAY